LTRTVGIARILSYRPRRFGGRDAHARSGRVGKIALTALQSAAPQ
jgi:hypothetical protein